MPRVVRTAPPPSEPFPDIPRPRGRRLKQWRYVGAYGPDFMLCAAVARVGRVPNGWWAILDAATGELHDRTVVRTSAIQVGERARFGGRGVHADLQVTPEGDAVEITSEHDGAPIWTRKQSVRVHGTITIAGAERAVDLAGLTDYSAGYHARHTEWHWSAGVGRATDGRAVAWNLVDGIHDSARDSERTVWVDGVATEAEPQEFSPDLDRVGDLRFAAQAERAANIRLGPLRSYYRQPFGTFAGTLPGGLSLAEGYGVMEHHDVRW